MEHLFALVQGGLTEFGDAAGETKFDGFVRCARRSA